MTTRSMTTKRVRSNLTATEKLREGGIYGKKADHPKVPVQSIRWPTGAIAHPRQHLPADRALVDDMKRRGFRPECPLIVRDGGVDERGVRILDLVCGSRRLNAALVVELEFVAEGKCEEYVPGTESGWYVHIEFFKGDDRAVIAERLRENYDPLKLPDSPSVLYATYRQLAVLGMEPDEMPLAEKRGVTRGVLAALLDWPNIVEAAASRFESGEAPLALLPVVLDCPRDGQASALDRFIVAGAMTARKARKALRGGKNRDGSDPKPRTAKPDTRAGRLRVAAALANGRSKSLPAGDLVIARAIAAYERYVSGEKSALNYLPSIKAIVDDVLPEPTKATDPDAGQAAE